MAALIILTSALTWVADRLRWLRLPLFHAVQLWWRRSSVFRSRGGAALPFPSLRPPGSHATSTLTRPAPDPNPLQLVPSKPQRSQAPEAAPGASRPGRGPAPSPQAPMLQAYQTHPGTRATQDIVRRASVRSPGPRPPSSKPQAADM